GSILGLKASERRDVARPGWYVSARSMAADLAPSPAVQESYRHRGGGRCLAPKLWRPRPSRRRCSPGSILEEVVNRPPAARSIFVAIGSQRCLARIKLPLLGGANW